MYFIDFDWLRALYWFLVTGFELVSLIEGLMIKIGFSLFEVEFVISLVDAMIEGHLIIN